MKKGVTLAQLKTLEDLQVEISRAKMVEEKDLNKLEELVKKIPAEVQALKPED